MSDNLFSYSLSSPSATDALGQRLAECLLEMVKGRVKGGVNEKKQSIDAQLDVQPFVIYLQGPLGAGKSALVRACLRALEVEGTIRSPTYTLVEQYSVTHEATREIAEESNTSDEMTTRDLHMLHMDLYRLADPEELGYLGLRESSGIWFVEWPDKGKGELPAADLVISLEYDIPKNQDVQSQEVSSDVGRNIMLEVHNPAFRWQHA